MKTRLASTSQTAPFRLTWLLVVAAFLLVIASWIVALKISSRVPTQRLSPTEERQVLIQKGNHR